MNRFKEKAKLIKQTQGERNTNENCLFIQAKERKIQRSSLRSAKSKVDEKQMKVKK